MIPYELSVLIAVLAFVYAGLLTKPDKLLNAIYNRLDKAFKTDDRINSGKPIHPLFMLLIHCEQCIAGQVALWLYLGLYAVPCYNYHGLVITLLKLLFFVAHTIFAAAIIKGIYNKYIE